MTYDTTNRPRKQTQPDLSELYDRLMQTEIGSAEAAEIRRQIIERWNRA